MRALSFLLLLLGCGGGSAEQAPAAPVIPVELDTLRSDTITRTVTVVGRLAPVPGGSAALTAPMDAVVRRVAVSIGDRVGRGDVLIELDAPELAGQAAALRAQADAATANAVRQRRLLTEGITARRSVEEQEAVATAAEAAARAAEALLVRSQLVSPLSGVVAEVTVQPGERVAAGQALAAVVDDAVLDLVAAVPAADLGLLRVGLTAQIAVEGGGAAATGRVRAIAPALDTSTNAAQVLIRVSGGGAGMRAGASTEARVSVETRRGVLVVPDSALVLVGNEFQVFVLGADSIVRGHAVVVGVRQGGRAEITGDLRAGEVIVTSGAYGLPDSSRVTLRRAAP
ncbi:MAG: efflux RND transporter periplasmic adaptor subunit [Gemmatimonadota bacterium]|nr:efflux RND transporter periplasmic adaptor subunit [Gemmatimonadota bacterium]